MQKCVAVETGFVSFSELAKEVGGVARAGGHGSLRAAAGPSASTNRSLTAGLARLGGSGGRRALSMH